MGEVVDHCCAALRAIRARCAEVDVTYEALDDAAGLPARYSSKCLAPNPTKRYSAFSLFLILQTLGLTAALVPIVAASEVRERIGKRLIRPKMLSGGEHKAVTITLGPDFFAKLGRQGNAARNRSLSPAERRRLARNAALARWARADLANARDTP